MYPRIIANQYLQLREDEGADSAEVYFRRLMDSAVQEFKVSRRFKVPCELQGYRGYDNANYSEGMLKMAFRRGMAVLAPWAWV